MYLRPHPNGRTMHRPPDIHPYRSQDSDTNSIEDSIEDPTEDSIAANRLYNANRGPVSNDDECPACRYGCTAWYPHICSPTVANKEAK